MPVRRGGVPTRGIKERAQVTEKGLIQGPFMGTMQAGPARPTRAHGLSDEHQDRGLLYVEKKIWDDAIKEFEKSVDLSPEFSEGWNNLGLCYLYTNRVDEAIEALNTAIKHFPGWHIALANLGLAYHRAKKPDQSTNYYRQSVSKYPKQPQVWFALGEALEAAGQIDEAIDAYRTATSHHKKYDVALFRMGMLLARKDSVDEAESALKTALDQNPSLAEAAGVLGAIAARRGQLDVAKDYYERAQAAKPDKVPATAAKGLAALELFEKSIKKNFEEMKGEFSDLPSIAECMFNAGLCYLKSDNLAMARTSFESAAAEDSEWAEPRIWLGMIDALENRPVEAKRVLDDASKLVPDNALVQESIGLTCLVVGLTKESEKFFNEARRLGRAIPIHGSSARLPAQE